MLHRILSRVRHIGADAINGYDSPEVTDVVFRRTAAFHPTHGWPEMAQVTTVLDFGGACGGHYKIARNTEPSIRWAVVETPAMVERAKALQTDRLCFFTSIKAAAAWLGDVEVMHSDGALQYANPAPQAVLRDLCAAGAHRMMWRRLALSPGADFIRTVETCRLEDNGPLGTTIGSVRAALVHVYKTEIPEKVFRNAHHAAGYRLLHRDGGNFTFEMIL